MPDNPVFSNLVEQLTALILAGATQNTRRYMEPAVIINRETFNLLVGSGLALNPDEEVFCKIEHGVGIAEGGAWQFDQARDCARMCVSETLERVEASLNAETRRLRRLMRLRAQMPQETPRLRASIIASQDALMGLCGAHSEPHDPQDEAFDLHGVKE